MPEFESTWEDYAPDTKATVHRDSFCAFNRLYSASSFIRSVYVKDQNDNVLLNIGDYTEAGPSSGRDETSETIECNVGDTLDITVYWTSPNDDCDYYGLMWGHTAGYSDLVKIANLEGGIGPCSWPVQPGVYSHNYQWVVPDETGTHMVSWWCHWLGWTDAESNVNWIDGCGDNDYGDRVDVTLTIAAGVAQPEHIESTWEDYAPGIRAIINDFHTWSDIAPAYQWTIDTLEPLRRVYVATFHASGLDDLEIPMSSLQFRLRNDGWSYVVCVFPDADTYEDQVEAFKVAEGEIRIFSGWTNQAGERQLQEMARADISRYSTDVGVQSSSLTLTAYREISIGNPRAVTLTNITVRSLQADGKRRVRCEPNIFLRPGDTAVFGADSMTVDSLAVMIDRNQQRMEVTGW